MQSNFFACLRLQLRLVCRRIPVLVAAVLAALLLAAATAAAGGLFYTGQSFSGFVIAVASEDEDPQLDLLVELLSGMDEIRDVAAIRHTGSEEAADMVRSGQATCALILPTGFWQSVMSGENLSPTLLVDHSRPLEAMLVAKLAESAVRMLTRAQQGVALTIEVYGITQPDSPTLSQAIRDVNLAFAFWVLGKGAMFRTTTVSPTGSLSLVQFYLLGAAIYFAFLCLPALHRFFSPREQQGWLRRLRAGGVPIPAWAAAQILAGAFAILLTLGLLLAGIGLFGGGNLLSPAALPGLLACALFLSCFGFLCCGVGGILASVSLDFLFSTVALLVSGGLVPLVLLPAPLAALAPFSPFSWMHQSLAPLFGADFSLPALLLLLGGSAILFAAALFLAGRRGGRAGA